MTALSIIGCGVLGFVATGLLRIAVRRSSVTPTCAGPLAPPMLLEMLTAGLCSALAWRVGVRPELAGYLGFAAVGVLLAAIDCQTRRLPTRLIWISGGVVAALFGYAAAANNDWGPLLRSAAAMLVLLAFYGALYFARPGELGGGDLRLAIMSGLVLGWAGWPTVATGTLLSWVTAALWLLTLRLHPRDAAPRDLPLGPFMVFGAVAGVLVSSAG